jgi:glycosyltransferase involved in cell wall biosynthesis
MRAEPLPLITVFVPWIGREPFIGFAIASLLRQDYPNLEILISDNSLSPAAPSLIAGFRDRRIRVIERSERRLTPAAHFAACLQDARGEYVMILSDDDLVEPRYVSSMYEAMRSRPDVTVCIGEQIAIGEDDTVTPPASATVACRTYDGPAFLMRRFLNLHGKPILTYMSLFARRADMLRHSYRDYPDGSHTDNYMMMALTIPGRVAVSSAKFYYRIYEKSAGLATSFPSLLAACTQYERDARLLLRSARSRIGTLNSVVLSALLHIRTSGVMYRRLFQMYRKRLQPTEFFVSLARLLLYTCGVSRPSPLPRS